MWSLKAVVCLLAVIMYVMVITFKTEKVLITSITAFVVVAFGVMFPGKIFALPQDVVALDNILYSRLFVIQHVFLDIINWNVMMIYIGSMIIASLFIYSKVPSKIADSIVCRSKNVGLAMLSILALTGFISIFVENVATVLVMAPIAISICKKNNINPTIFMMGLAVMSNLEGTATLVGDPPSMIFASFAGYSFNDFFFKMGKPSLFFIVQAGFVAGCIFFYFVLSKKFKSKLLVADENVVSWFPFILLILMIASLVIVSFLFSRYEYMSGFIVLSLGFIGLIWYWLFQKKSLGDVKNLIMNLDFESVFFLLGIFIVIGAIQETGFLDKFSVILSDAGSGSVFFGFCVIILVSIVVSGFIDNVPYIIAMLPVVEGMAESLGVCKELFMFALLIGCCLGGNLTPFGASANIVAMGIVKKEGNASVWGKWIKICGSFTLITTVVASAVLWLIWS